MVNPYTINFGVEPSNYIERTIEVNEVIENFKSEKPSCHLYMITGIRGCGKTVTMTEIEKNFRNDKSWIVIDLNPELDLLEEFAAELSNEPSAMQIFKDAKINLSVLGFGLEIDGVPPITNVVSALDRMLDRLTKQKKRVLITIDEVTNNANVRAFASQFQIFLRKNYNIFMLMTGLYDNVYNLQNEKSLTFLYRAPKLRLNPLNVERIAADYKKQFQLDDMTADDMARMTMGYSYAYQVLGYICCKYEKTYTEILDEFDLYMQEYVYEKIWSELSGGDKKTLYAMCKAKDMKASSIREASGQDSNLYNRYRNRLMAKEVIAEGEYGFVRFTLPRFKEFVLKKEKYDGK